MTRHAADIPALAARILEQAIDDLRRDAVQVGRQALFERLLPCLLDPSVAAPQDHPLDAEQRRALARLGQRLRERVDARLRAIEPDVEQRRMLRRRLRTQLRQQETAQ